MARMSRWHQELTDGVGKCSVPMWSGGCPAGFCDRPAYGEPVPCEKFRDRSGTLRRKDGRYDGYVPGLACELHGGPAAPVVVDEQAKGQAWFLASIMAVQQVAKPGGIGFVYHHGARVLAAASQREAEGVALHDLRESHPNIDGWGSYDVLVIPFDRYEERGER